MTASVVADVTDVVRDGRPVVGYGFNSNGRYAASGLLNEGCLPRLHESEGHERDHRDVDHGVVPCAAQKIALWRISSQTLKNLQTERRLLPGDSPLAKPAPSPSSLTDGLIIRI